MQPATSTIERWHPTTVALLPMVLALITAVVAVLGFVVWSTGNIDQRAAERQTTMISHVVEGRLSRIVRETASVAINDETLRKTSAAFDSNWIETNVGEWLYRYFRHDQTILLSAQGAPVYAMVDGAAVDVSTVRDMLAGLESLITEARALRPGQRPPPAPLDAPAGLEGQPPILPPRPPPPSVTDFAIIDGKPAIVAALPVIGERAALRPQPGTEPIILAVQFLDGRAASQINREFLFDDGRFTLVESSNPNRLVYPILSASGRFVAFFEWNRDRPGYVMLLQTGPLLVGAFLLAGILIFLLLGQLRRSAAAVENARRLSLHQASHDALTGLDNRMSFDAKLAEAAADKHNANAHLTLFMLDLDRFKQVNDTLGHQAGDELICTVGDRLRAIFGTGTMIARLGGDEFAVLAITHDKPVDVMEVSARIIESIGRPFTLSRFKAHVGVSIGIVMARGRDAEPTELVRRADIALYEAKAGGRNRAAVYEEHMNELLQLQHTIEAELREALCRDDQLSIVFQPLIDQVSRKVIGAEALARWYHPKFGQISPARFIPVAESTGLIETLGEFVLRRACLLGATVPGRTIAVNISPTQLRNPQFSHQVFDILHETGMRPLDLELEITESILLDDEHVSSQNLRTFRAAGIHIALDDFGTGYSSLSYLKRYPVDRIKIDRSFVSQLTDGHVSVAITDAIVKLAHAMELQVTAEGVETEEQATILGSLGCNTLQGFLFSGGMVADRITDIFAAPENAMVSRQQRRTAMRASTAVRAQPDQSL
ncbi:putative bifunctional diguanylate cyclase/phosphodiesterase [Devosia beringensis]|uniref:putative bifunctional diguanylate cyclase/phosphodiesterase n=1 Tax=Devosia beringensis TaxID=2657486 RepID=UPI00186B5B6B|nr:EAL domain-containing protein [Devosia beringensis]